MRTMNKLIVLLIPVAVFLGTLASVAHAAPSNILNGNLFNSSNLMVNIPTPLIIANTPMPPISPIYDIGKIDFAPPELPPIKIDTLSVQLPRTVIPLPPPPQSPKALLVNPFLEKDQDRFWVDNNGNINYEKKSICF